MESFLSLLPSASSFGGSSCYMAPAMARGRSGSVQQMSATATAHAADTRTVSKPTKALKRRPQPRKSRRSTRKKDHGDTPSSRSTRKRDHSEYLYGLYPVLAALASQRRRFKQLWLRGGASDEQATRPAAQKLAALVKELQDSGDLTTVVSGVSEEELSKLARSSQHDGVVLAAEPLAWKDLEALPTPEPGALWIVAEGITDHMNLAKIVQAAAFVQASGMVVSAKGSCSLGVHESVASAGHSEVFPFFRNRSLWSMLAEARNAGWCIVGTGPTRLDDDLEVWPCSDIDARLSQWCSENDAAKAVVLVLGAEGPGLSEELTQVCSALANIPGGEGDLDSLNVGVASGILLHRFRQAVGEAPAL
mmetsp:Transcript_12163/g.28380  ORF Transcript_12163/g.28380 Transcript_12163/m.28380 type:complete len:363 (+) Transcript_12163:143-1231(+)